MLNEKFNQYSYILDQTARKVKQYAQLAFKENQFDITVDQWSALKYIYEYPNISNKELATKCGKDQPTLTRIVDLLIKKELVHRVNHDSDRRTLKLQVTNKGSEKVKEIAPKVAELRMKAWENLDEKDFEHFIRILRTIHKNLTTNSKEHDKN